MPQPAIPAISWLRLNWLNQKGGLTLHSRPHLLQLMLEVQYLRRRQQVPEQARHPVIPRDQARILPPSAAL